MLDIINLPYFLTGFFKMERESEINFKKRDYRHN